MSRRKLTAKQHAFLEYIKNYVRENGIWPTYREIIEMAQCSTSRDTWKEHYGRSRHTQSIEV